MYTKEDSQIRLRGIFYYLLQRINKINCKMILNIKVDDNKIISLVWNSQDFKFLIFIHQVYKRPLIRKFLCSQFLPKLLKVSTIRDKNICWYVRVKLTVFRFPFYKDNYSFQHMINFIYRTEFSYFNESLITFSDLYFAYKSKRINPSCVLKLRNKYEM